MVRTVGLETGTIGKVRIEQVFEPMLSEVQRIEQVFEPMLSEVQRIEQVFEPMLSEVQLYLHFDVIAHKAMALTEVNLRSGY